MAKESGKSRDEILALLEQVRPLEFYMPVDEHRESWTGGTDLLVASVLEDHTLPTGYSLAGLRVPLSTEAQPVTPVLAVVPVETDFTESLPAGYQNSQDAAGNAIGTWASMTRSNTDTCLQPPCSGDSDEGSSGGGGLPPAAPGRYMTFSYIKDDGEAWTRGDPEIEVHIHGPVDAANPTYGADLACAGARQLGERRFDQNSGTWSGRVLLFTAAQNADFGSKFNEGYNVMAWEDDDTSCTIKSDNVNLGNTLRGVGTIASGVVAVVVAKNPLPTIAAAGTFIAGLYSSAGWLKSNDDFLGVATRIEFTPYSGQYSDANYILYKQNNAFNGRIKLIDY
jgi:hypothetical protein